MFEYSLLIGQFTQGTVGEIQQADRVIYAVEQHKVLVPGNCNRLVCLCSDWSIVINTEF